MAKKTVSKEENMYDGFMAKAKALKKDQPFMATLTVFNQGGAAGKELETFLFINNFPYEEITGTKEKISELIDEIK